MTQDTAHMHPDDIAVDRFAAAMKAKLARKRIEGRGGWDNPDECSRAFLSQLLVDHVEKGDPVDVGNLAMMLHQRGERIVIDEAASTIQTLSARNKELEAENERLREAEPVAWRARHSEQENWYIHPSPVGWWECQPLYASPPTSEIEALRKRVAELEKALEPFAKEADGRKANDMRGAVCFYQDALREARRVLEGGKVE